jgi:hypothetical protein
VLRRSLHRRSPPTSCCLAFARKTPTLQIISGCASSRTLRRRSSPGTPRLASQQPLVRSRNQSEFAFQCSQRAVHWAEECCSILPDVMRRRARPYARSKTVGSVLAQRVERRRMLRCVDQDRSCGATYRFARRPGPLDHRRTTATWSMHQSTRWPVDGFLEKSAKCRWMMAGTLARVPAMQRLAF